MKKAAMFLLAIFVVFVLGCDNSKDGGGSLEVDAPSLHERDLAANPDLFAKPNQVVIVDLEPVDTPAAPGVDTDVPGVDIIPILYGNSFHTFILETGVGELYSMALYDEEGAQLLYLDEDWPEEELDLADGVYYLEIVHEGGTGKNRTLFIRPGSTVVSPNCSNCNLSNADLSGANLSGADLSGANLDGANLDGANLDGSTLRPIPYHKPGVTYNGLHTTQSPTTQDVATDFQTVNQHFGVIRTYYCQYAGGQVQVGPVAKQNNLNALLGLFLFDNHDDWIAADYNNYLKPAAAGGNVIGILIGNEKAPAQLDLIKTYVSKAKSDMPKVPVSSAEQTNYWLNDPTAADLASMVDFIAANLYPTWDWTTPGADNQPQLNDASVTPAQALASVKDQYAALVKKYPNKQIVITEIGWPTTYGWPANNPITAPTGLQNQKDFLNLVWDWATSESINVYLFCMYDGLYGVSSSSLYNFHFGLWDAQGANKGWLPPQ